MKTCQIIHYRISYWTKGYNKGKINAMLTTDTGENVIVENLTPDQGTFLLSLLKQPGMLKCDPEHPEGLLHLHVERQIASD